MMRRFLRNPLVCLMPAVLLFTACVTTDLNAVWQDPSYKERPAKIMVIGMGKNPISRRIFEDEFVAQIKARGTEAIASYTVLPDKQQGDHDAIAAKVKEMGADTLLITRIVSKKFVQSYVPPTPMLAPAIPPMPGNPYLPPPYYGSWPDYYGYGSRYMYTPGYVAEDEYAIIETNLYDAKTDKLVWAASSETNIGDSNQAFIHGYVETMVKHMAARGLAGK